MANDPMLKPTYGINIRYDYGIDRNDVTLFSDNYLCDGCVTAGNDETMTARLPHLRAY